MFAVEVDFRDGVSAPELLLVRRSSFLIGTGEAADLVVEGKVSENILLRVSRAFGRRFFCHRLPSSNFSYSTDTTDDIYDTFAQIAVGSVLVTIIPLDPDLKLHEDEAPDERSIEVLRQAFVSPYHSSSAILVRHAAPFVVSWWDPDGSVIGRSRASDIRIVSEGIADTHALLSEDNGQLYLEPICGSLHRMTSALEKPDPDQLASGQLLMNGPEIFSKSLFSQHDKVKLNNHTLIECLPREAVERALLDVLQRPVNARTASAFPKVVSASPYVQPVRFQLAGQRRFTVGRDPASDIWVNAEHISRRHAELVVSADGEVSIIDVSTNGTLINGERLTPSQENLLPETLSTVDLMEGIVLGICFSEDDEREFMSNIWGESTARPLESGLDRVKTAPKSTLGPKNYEEIDEVLSSYRHNDVDDWLGSGVEGAEVGEEGEEEYSSLRAGEYSDSDYQQDDDYQSEEGYQLRDDENYRDGNYRIGRGLDGWGPNRRVRLLALLALAAVALGGVLFVTIFLVTFLGR